MKNSDIFYITDTETTGLNPQTADIIEISILTVEKQGEGKFAVVDEYDSYINPLYPLPPEIVRFNQMYNTGITDDFLSDKPLAQFVANDIMDIFGRYPIVVGHNISFDLGFIDKLYRQYLGIPFEYIAKYDTLADCKKVFPNAENHKLATMFEMSKKEFSSEHPNFHNSLADCYATLDVLKMLADKEIKDREERKYKNGFYRGY